MSGAGNGTGSGSGNGTNNSATQTTSPIRTSQTSALKILLKPRPKYTDWARFYQISGNVTVRVTFTASGKIGSISPTSKLPFGLTNAAVDAARGILFEPAMKEGTPYTVSKIVQYNFILY